MTPRLGKIVPLLYPRTQLFLYFQLLKVVGWGSFLMRTVDLIQRKRAAEELSPEEIAFLVNGYTSGEIPDYQMSAFLMAVFFSGMSDRAVSRLTECMLRSGDTVDLSHIPGVKVDKHST